MNYSNGKTDYGIPNDETAKLYNQQQYNPNVRDSESQADYGIPNDQTAKMEEKAIIDWNNSREENFNNIKQQIVSSVETNYITNFQKQNMSFENTVEGDYQWAYDRLLYSDKMSDTPQTVQQLAGYLEKLKEHPNLYTSLMLEMCDRFSDIKKKSLTGQWIGTNERERLFNYMKIISIMEEKKYPLDYSKLNQIEMPYSHNYGEYYDTEKVPYDIAIYQMIEVVDKKMKDVDTEIIDPINIVAGTEGKEKIDVKTLGKLTLKSHYTNHSLSDDSNHYGNSNTFDPTALQKFKDARNIQQELDKLTRENKLATLSSENKGFAK